LPAYSSWLRLDILFVYTVTQVIPIQFAYTFIPNSMYCRFFESLSAL
jgi:hypothetical protein